MDQLLQQVRDFADQAHGAQLRKYTSDRYIVHPVRVMEISRNYTDDVTMLAAALLHDVLEDTPVTKTEMGQFLSTLMNEQQAKRTLLLVEELTDVYVKSAYPDWNRRKRKEKELERLEKSNADSQTIKYADIMDNCKEIVSHDKQFARIFLHECRNILKRLTKGNQGLYTKTVETVDHGIKQLGGRS